MGKCKNCYSRSRAYRTKLLNELGAEKVQSLEASNPQVLADCEAEFDTEWDAAKRAGRKMKFSCGSTIAALESRSGVRIESSAPMWWKGRYAEWAKSAAGGFLLDEEVETNWNKWPNTPGHPRDWDGPRGFIQLAIPGVNKTVTDYQDLFCYQFSDY